MTEILWKRNRTSLSSPEIWEILRPRSLRKSNVELNGPRFSTNTDWKTYWAPRSAYLAVFLSAAWSATSPAPVPAVSTYDPASVLATVTSHRRGLPLCHFPSCLFRPDGSLTAGTSAALMARKIMSLSTWCLATLLGAFLPSCRRGSCSCCYYYYQYAQIWSMSMHHFSHSTPDHHFRHSCLELSSACSTVFAWLFASVNGAWNLSSSDVTWKQLTHCTQCSSGVFHTDLCNYLHITSTT